MLPRPSQAVKLATRSALAQKVLGYYKDQHQPNLHKKEISIYDALIDCATPMEDKGGRVSSTRRQLDKSGKRFRGKSKRWNAIRYAFAAATLLMTDALRVSAGDHPRALDCGPSTLATSTAGRLASDKCYAGRRLT